MSQFKKSVTFEIGFAVSRASCFLLEALRNLRKAKGAFSKVIRLSKKPQMSYFNREAK
jgi:hypothetical protein